MAAPNLFPYPLATASLILCANCQTQLCPLKDYIWKGTVLKNAALFGDLQNVQLEGITLHHHLVGSLDAIVKCICCLKNIGYRLLNPSIGSKFILNMNDFRIWNHTKFKQINPQTNMVIKTMLSMVHPTYVCAKCKTHFIAYCDKMGRNMQNTQVYFSCGTVSNVYVVNNTVKCCNCEVDLGFKDAQGSLALQRSNMSLVMEVNGVLQSVQE